MSTYILLLSITPSLAQTTITGKITDKQNTPIPYAHIQIENTNSGTVSNENGLFKLVFADNSIKRTIIVSSLGYQSKKVVLEAENNLIVLSPDIIQLQSVTITSKNPAKELINNAIRSIPNNYPLVEERHYGFFREVTHWNKQKEPIYIAETSIESIKKSYSKKQLSGDVKLVEFRKYKSTQLDSLNTRIHAGVHHIHRFDVVARREDFLQKLDRFKYKIVDTISRRDKNIYKIHFRNKEKISGYVYILDSTFAIIKAEFKQSSGFNHFLFSPENRKYLNYTVTYEQGKDSLWRFKQSNYKTAFKRKNKVLVLSSEYVTTNIEPNSKKMAYSDKFQYSDILLNKEKVYKPNFWRNYNIILPNKKYENLFKSNNFKTISKQKKWLNFLLKLKREIALSCSTINVSSYNLLFENSSLNLQETINSSNRNIYGLSYSLLYEFKPNFYLGYLGEAKIFKSGISSHNLSFQRQIKINPKRRPIFLTPSMNFGHQQLDYFLGTFNTKENLNVNGKSLNNGKTSVFLSQRNFRLQPNFALSIEKNRRLNFLFSIGYNIPISKKEGLLFQEKEGFFLFRKKQFIKNNRESLTINYNGNLLENKFSLNAGVSIQL
ncbi:hypothetical protein BWZ22_07225 [Seonamhaeicola sp. S2-3]|uniref:carboxypeptidase-like regulatory domain-containing protein n=1 Tax=Seonamhaeicola sp. S2-3 TaxID=1936081 RepID=UPI000972A439|nr:carboxypeptidase-like regulatory domain-containing protein [Seonamhaeicola sp. S2-3]APY11045.1 hypothetical protein BWZ22_07225 [Seonamhaeicola sp. S2-3]